MWRYDKNEKDVYIQEELRRQNKRSVYFSPMNCPNWESFRSEVDLHIFIQDYIRDYGIPNPRLQIVDIEIDQTEDIEDIEDVKYSNIELLEKYNLN